MKRLVAESLNEYLDIPKDEDVIPGEVCLKKNELTTEIINAYNRSENISIKQTKCRDFFYDKSNQSSVSDKIIEHFFK